MTQKNAQIDMPVVMPNADSRIIPGMNEFSLESVNL